MRIWKVLEEKRVARFPLPIIGRIPNFIGSEKAAINLTRTEEFKKSKVIKVSPDSPQRPVRELVLKHGKILIVPTPRLRGEFYLLDPNEIDDFYRASTIPGVMRYGKVTDFSSISKIDMIVTGSVAVTLKGERVGKGEGYSELEFAILRELGKVDEFTPIATTVHELQIVDKIPTEVFDVPVDIIVTPERIHYVSPRRPKPKGLYIEYLTREKIEKTPFLKKIFGKYW
ncbi:MAG: 5-formyltetrahydrofolate cyclo-ligase [Sulfolobaceae archaeon]